MTLRKQFEEQKGYHSVEEDVSVGDGMKQTFYTDAYVEWLEARSEKQAKEIDHLEYGIERYEWWCKHDQAEIKKLKKAIAGRDKTILDWLAKSKRQIRHRKRYQQKCTDLLAELSTLKQSIADAPKAYCLKNEDGIDIESLQPEEWANSRNWGGIKVALLEIKEGK